MPRRYLNLTANDLKSATKTWCGTLWTDQNGGADRGAGEMIERIDQLAREKARFAGL